MQELVLRDLILMLLVLIGAGASPACEAVGTLSVGRLRELCPVGTLNVANMEFQKRIVPSSRSNS